MVVVRRVSEEDWREVREVRLAALADSPSAFGSTLSEERAHDEDDWREWCGSSAVFVARDGEVPVGMVAGFDGASPAERRLVALWVHPDHRGAGVASALLAAVEDWARADGADRLLLWVADGNGTARRLYGRHGFAASGRHQTLPSDPDVDEEQLRLVLGRGAVGDR